MRYLLTGGAGFIGSALTRRLLADGHEVTVLDDCSRGRPRRLSDLLTDRRGPLDLVQGDVRDLRTVLEAAADCDRIVHLAYLQGTQNFYSSPVQVLDVATRGILNVLEACKTLGIGDLMVLSSSEAYQVASIVPTPETISLTVPDPLNPRYSYGGGKILHELFANAWICEGLLDRAMIVRPHNIIGPDMGREHVVPQFALRMNELTAAQPEGRIDFPILGTGLETRSFCWINTCIDQLALILDKADPGVSVWHVGTMDEHTVEEVAHQVAAYYKRDIQVIPGKLAEGSPPRRLPDTAKVERLGYLPGARLTFYEAIAATVAWYASE